MRNKNFFLLLSGIIILVAVAVAVAFLLWRTPVEKQAPLAVTTVTRENAKGQTKITTEILEERIKELSQYESLEVDEKIHQTYVYKGNSNDLVINGKAIYTTDFAEMQVDNFLENSQNMKIILPLPKITTITLDEQHMAYDAKTTTLQKLKELVGGDELAASMLAENMKEAKEGIRNRANTIENLTKAKENAQEKVTKTCKSLGWTVTILWSNT